jgi:siroheme synthase-like protein
MFPIMLNIQGRLAVVVGGGAVGRRRAEALLAAGAMVRLVDPSSTEGPAGVETVARAYESAHLQGAAIVFACTDDRAINARVAADARARRAWVNVADDPAACDFTLPAVHRGGGIVLAIGTVGGTPALAGAFRDELAKHLPAGADGFALALAAVRERLKVSQGDPQRRRELLRQLSGPEGQAAFARGGQAALESMAELG